MNRKPSLLFVSLLLLLALACNVTFTFGVPTPAAPPPTAVLPTATPLPLSAQVTLVSVPFIETNQSPPFTITAQTPQLTGSDDLRVQAFNQRMGQIVQKEVETFRTSFLQNPNPPLSGGSSLEATYTLVHQFGEIWSLKFDFSFYSDGAAHPGLYSLTLNYDLAQNRELTLGDLFLPNSNYLEMISNYCIAELGKQPFADAAFLEGASPTVENYRNWNITPQGLMITFDEYQVAPYAAGPQTVIVPYTELHALLAPHGPLADLIK